MNQFNLGNFVNSFINYSLMNARGLNRPNPNINPSTGLRIPNEALINQNFNRLSPSTFTFNSLAELRMNDLASFERGLYVKELMNLPKEIEEVLVLVQNQAADAKTAGKLLSTNINLSTLAELIQTSGKEAMNKLVMVMANASRQGITDLSQIKDAIKLINASISVASQENPNQVLKSFMLLYLPWLPLQEGVDFDLEIESSESESGEDDTTLTILITTKNYGNIRITLMLTNGVSLEMFVNCGDKFPKEDLEKRIGEESKLHALQPNMTFEQKAIKQDEDAPRQAKISMSNLKAVNPFLLLMANAVIRHTIELDNLAG